MSPNRSDSSRAILIGTAIYKDSGFSLVPAAANSLREFQAVLTDPALCDWPADRLTVIRDAPDPSAVLKQLRELAAETTGVLLVYFVGHGTIASDAKLCLALTGTDAAHPDITGLEYDRVRRALLASPARIKIVILDCCYSGRAIEALAGSGGIADAADIYGAYTLTASNQAARVPPLKDQATACTSFTGELLRLIREGVPGAPPQLTLADLYPHLHQRLHARDLPKPNQRGTGSAGNHPFTRNAAFPGRAPAVADPGDIPGRQVVAGGRSSGGWQLPVGRRTMVLGGLTAAASAAASIALIPSRPSRPSPSQASAPVIVTDNVQLRGHHSNVHVVAFRPHHGTTLASCSQDGTIRLWDTTTATTTSILAGNASVGEIAFSPDGKLLAGADDYDATVRLWDMATRRASILPGQTGDVFTVAFSDDGTTLASGSPVNQVQL